MNILLTLDSGMGANLGPNFNLTSNSGHIVTPNTATRAELIAGKSISISPDGAVNVFVTSTGACTNTLVINIAGITTSTTSTSTSTSTTGAPTSTTTSTSTSTTSTSTSTTTGAPIPVTLAYSNVDGPTACYKFTAPIPDTSTYYLQPGDTLTDGVGLYADSSFINPASDGFYSNGVDYWEVASSTGSVLTNGTPCPQTTTTTTSTSTTSTSTTSTSTSTTSTTSTSTSTSTSTTTEPPTTTSTSSTTTSTTEPPTSTTTSTSSTTSTTTIPLPPGETSTTTTSTTEPPTTTSTSTSTSTSTTTEPPTTTTSTSTTTTTTTAAPQCTYDGLTVVCDSTTTTTTEPPTTTTTTEPPTTTTTSGTSLLVYAKYINSNGNLQYQINGGPTEQLGALSSTCDYVTTLAITVGDEIVFSDANTKVVASSTTVCPDGPGGFGCTVGYSVLISGTQSVYITIDGSSPC